MRQGFFVVWLTTEDEDWVERLVRIMETTTGKDGNVKNPTFLLEIGLKNIRAQLEQLLFDNNLMAGCLPANLRKIQQYLDIASDYETMDVSVSYWCRLYALQQGFILQGGKEDLDYLLDLMKWVGEKKEELKSQKTVSDLCEARIHLENVALEFLKWAETANQLFPVNQFNKIVLGAFFSAETLFDVCSVFGELTEEMTEKKKYIALHLANVGNCQYLFNSAGKTNSVTQELNSKMLWSPEGKKIYNRDSLLELRNKPASQILPEKLVNDEVTRGVPSEEKIPNKNPPPEHPTTVEIIPENGLSKKEPKSKSAMMRKRSNGDVGKPKNAFKLKGKIETIPDELGIEDYIKQVVEILNGLNPSTYVNLLPKIKAFNLNTEERLSEVSKLLYEKAVEEPNFSLMYAKTCQCLSLKKPSVSNPTDASNFRVMLLARCLNEFDKASTGQYDLQNKKKEIESAETEAKKAELEVEMEELLEKRRKYGLANIRFIGELFKVKIVPTRIVHQCVVWLLSQDEDEEALECLCFLLISIGKDLEVPSARRTPNSKNKGTMTSYLDTLKTIADKARTSERIRSLIQNLIVLRNIGWLSLEDNNVNETNQVSNEHEGEIIVIQSNQDIVVVDGLTRNGVDVKKESRDADNTIENGDDNLFAEQDLDEAPRDLQEVTASVVVCKDFNSLELGTLNETPKSDVDSVVAMDEPLLNGYTSTSGNDSGDQENDIVSSEAVVSATTEFKLRLKQYLSSATSLPMDEVFEWIKKEYVDEVDSVFIRILTTCVLESAVTGDGSDSVMNKVELEHWTDLLDHYVNNILDREVHALLAVHNFAFERDYPEDMIQTIGKILFFGKVVSEDALVLWMEAFDDCAGCQSHLKPFKTSVLNLLDDLNIA
uniref:W2 domain-containing protein n=1 Tax=Daphnia galeata TaxID=27404 RepID=A0A8J2RUQ0_9CRUS|nr:unnamed protein product [Daphnia galeata]